ncbi:MAG TPA: SIMPL domain-containing protein [Candidatus Paceibacterota bacterium]|nr:SIMPL domain-containing protein [Candidatus Paceibacterota bacterium]
MQEQSSKETLFKVLSGFVGVLTILLIYAVFFGPISDYSKSLYSARTINVSATDKVTATPDIAQLSFSVVTEGQDITVITDENNKKINNAINMLKEKGIKAEDIKTTEYTLSPVYTVPGKEYFGDFVSKIGKYSLTQSVSVKIRDFKLISSILETLPGMGTNRISNISFGIDDPEKYLSEARLKAFEKARAKALTMAQQNGISLGKIMSVSDYTNSNYSLKESSSRDYGMGGSISAPIAAPSIEPGSQEVSVNVNITYEIR